MTILSRKLRIASLLKRYQFIDLAIAVSVKRRDRTDHLRKYVDGITTKTYAPFRGAISTIYGVKLGLDLTDRQDWSPLEAGIRRACNGKNEDMNLDAAKHLFALVRKQDANAFYHTECSLPLGPDRKCSFGMSHSLVRDQQAVFQFPYPRRKRLTDHQFHTMMSLIHLAYARDDYSQAAVEIADLSAAEATIRIEGGRIPGPRSPRIVAMPPEGPLPIGYLQDEIQDVYACLMALAEE